MSRPFPRMNTAISFLLAPTQPPSLPLQRSSCSSWPSSGPDLTSLASPLVLVQLVLICTIVPCQSVHLRLRTAASLCFTVEECHTRDGTASSMYVHPALCINKDLYEGLLILKLYKLFHDTQLVGRRDIIKSRKHDFWLSHDFTKQIGTPLSIT